MSEANIDCLKEFISAELQAQQQSISIIGELQKRIQDKSSKAGTRHEEVFTRHYLCPAIKNYFQLELKMPDDEIKKCLGTEGYKNCPGFGFTPALKGKHLLTKLQIIDSRPPASWYTKDTKKLMIII